MKINEKYLPFLYAAIAVMIAYFAYEVIFQLLVGAGLVKSKEAEETAKKPQENVELAKKEIEENKKKLSGSTLTTAQKALIRATYSDSEYSNLANKLYEAMNHVGTSSGVILDVFSKMKNRNDVLHLIGSYGVRQLYLFGLKDGLPADLISHLVSEGVQKDAEKGLKIHNVFYTI